MRSLFSRLVLAAFVLLVLLAVLVTWKSLSPLALRSSPLEIEITAGSGMRQIARDVASAGVEVEPLLLVVLARISGRENQVKAGRYEVSAGVTPWELLEKLVRGDASQGEFVLLEGWNLRRVRAEIARTQGLKHETTHLSEAELLARIGATEIQGEGLLLPDTYFYARGGSDLALFSRAYRAMQSKLAKAWARRAPGLPLASPYEALIMASLIEKETGVEGDRAKVASVFYNRLKSGMPLQTDPTVIYGLGERFDGNLRKADLLADSPFNTYTRKGLPPTPIAMPGAASLNAALNPPQTDFLYFVARGDGSSEFSRSLDEHNRAVTRYQKRRNKG